MRENQKPSVLHIVGSSKFGGATQIILSLANMARQKGLTAAILTDDSDTIHACEKLNIEVVLFKGLVRPIRPYADISAIIRLKQLLKERNDTIVHTHTLKGGIVGRLAAYSAGIPVIIHHSHGFSFNQDSSFLRKKMIACMEKYAARKCDRIISVNQLDIDLAAQWGIDVDKLFRYVPNGISKQMLNNKVSYSRERLIRELNLPSNAVLITVVGRLFSEKGHPVLFEAFPEIQKNMKYPVHVLLLGQGPHREKYQKMVEKQNISQHIHFMGHRSDCMEIAKSCDIFVLPSLREGHSITILEAMAGMIPIVATNIRGIADSVRDGKEALLVTPNNSSLLASAVTKMLNNKHLSEKMTNAAKERFEALFTEEKMLDSIWKIYCEVAQEKSLRIV